MVEKRTEPPPSATAIPLALPWTSCEHRMLVGVSGGCDSVALLRALHDHASRAAATGARFGPIVVGHFNHHLRGDDSTADAEFVERLCTELRLPLQLGESTSTDPPRARSEAAARRERYDFLLSTAERIGARYVLTAHSRDDQVETVLFRLLRGTGLRGLGGIRPARMLSPAVTLLRPMLDVTRRQVLDYLARLNQPFREDRSNFDRRFVRNRIRHELIPQLSARYFRHAPAAIARVAGQARQLQDWIEQLAASQLDGTWDVIRDADGRQRLTVHFPQNAPPPLRGEMVRLAWRRLGWPESGMADRHWRLLARSDPQGGEQPPRDLPGHVHASWPGPNRVVLVRAT